MSNPGTLYIVSTPIGNRDDMTFRAIETLKSVDLIACEDTRHSSKLLSHYGVRTKRISYYDEIEEQRSNEIIDKLKSGVNIALISDAGTPTISDPGYRLVQKTIAAGLTVIPVPGASALLSALVSSGFATDRFTFEGFLPRKKGRKSRLQELATESRTIILFESPLRLLKTLDDLKEYFGDRNIAVGREMTKYYEEYIRGAISTVLAHYREKKPKGEFVIIVEGLTRRIRKGMKDNSQC